jgi:hypothetical protein
MRNKSFIVSLVLVGSFSAIGIYYVMKDIQPSAQLVNTNSVSLTRPFFSGEFHGLKEAKKFGGECSLDYLAQDGKKIDKGGVASSEKKTQFYGWGAVENQASNLIVLEIKPIDSSGKQQSLYAKMGEGGVERKDVVSATGRSNLLNSGYYAEGDFAGAEGTYDLFLVMKTKNGFYQCDLDYRLTVKRSM